MERQKAVEISKKMNAVYEDLFRLTNKKMDVLRGLKCLWYVYTSNLEEGVERKDIVDEIMNRMADMNELNKQEEEIYQRAAADGGDFMSLFK